MKSGEMDEVVRTYQSSNNQSATFKWGAGFFFFFFFRFSFWLLNYCLLIHFFSLSLDDWVGDFCVRLRLSREKFLINFYILLLKLYHMLFFWSYCVQVWWKGDEIGRDLKGDCLLNIFSYFLTLETQSDAII